MGSIGRPACEETKLGRLLNERGVHTYELGNYIKASPRIITEYCAGRRAIPKDKLILMGEFFDLDPEFIKEEPGESQLQAENDLDLAQPRLNPSEVSREYKQKLGLKMPGLANG